MSEFNADMGNDIFFEYGAFGSDGYTFLPSETISAIIWYREQDNTKMYYDWDDGSWDLSGSIVQLSGVLTPDEDSESYYLRFNPNNRADQYTVRLTNSTEDSVAKSKITENIYVTDYKRNR